MKNISTDINFEKEINATDKLVLVDFFATWCEPCSVLGPILEKLSEHFKENIIFIKADINNIPITAQKFSVDRIPNVILFKNGKPISNFVGLVPENAIKEWLENIIKNPTTTK